MKEVSSNDFFANFIAAVVAVLADLWLYICKVSSQLIEHVILV